MERTKTRRARCGGLAGSGWREGLMGELMLGEREREREEIMGEERTP